MNSRLDESRRLETLLEEIRSEIHFVKGRLSQLESDFNKVEKQFAVPRNQSTISLSTERTEDSRTQLIGKLPMILLSTEYFPDNETLIGFSEKSLGLAMPKGHRSKKEIMGIIITEVVRLRPQKIEEFSRIIDQVMGKKPKGKKSFFEEWDKAIKEMRFR
jgi:hypothetical protein